MKPETIQKLYMYGVMIAVTLVIAGILHFSCKERPVGAELTTSIDDLKTTIESDKQDDGKYKRRDKETIDGIDYEVHEYETPKGEIGYMIYMTKEDDKGIYRKTEITGVNAEIIDWIKIREIKELTATSTEK